MKRMKARFDKGFRVGIGNKRSQAAEMVLEAGETEGGSHNHHRGADQWLYVVSGSGVAVISGKSTKLLPDTLVLIERGENHEIRNTGKSPLRTLSIYIPPAYRRDGETLPPGRP